LKRDVQNMRSAAYGAEITGIALHQRITLAGAKDVNKKIGNYGRAISQSKGSTETHCKVNNFPIEYQEQIIVGDKKRFK
jgi:hypothetical protein